MVTCLFLFAGTIMVPIATKLKLGSVLGYIIAGIAISPLLGALKVDVLTLQHFAEFGVVMMLFLVGLELEPQALWKMKAKLAGLGGLQVSVTIALVMGIALAFGLHWKTSLAIGFIFALSSTAIVLQTLIGTSAWMIFFIYVEKMGPHEMQVSSAVKMLYMLLGLVHMNQPDCRHCN